jgi:hypothetical protein
MESPLSPSADWAIGRTSGSRRFGGPTLRDRRCCMLPLALVPVPVPAGCLLPSTAPTRPASGSRLPACGFRRRGFLRHLRPALNSGPVLHPHHHRPASHLPPPTQATPVSRRILGTPCLQPRPLSAPPHAPVTGNLPSLPIPAPAPFPFPCSYPGPDPGPRPSRNLDLPCRPPRYAACPLFHSSPMRSRIQ